MRGKIVAKKNPGRPKWTKWVVPLRFDSEEDARAFAEHVRRTGVVHMPESSEWQQLNAEVASEPHLDPRGHLIHHKEYQS